jgi:hypothetical protein
MTLNKTRFVYGSFIVVLCMGFLLGMVVGGNLWAALGGVGWSFVAIFVGTVIGHMNGMEDNGNAVREIESQQAVIEFEKEDLARRERRMGAASLGTVRAVSDRVANRIMSKFVSGMGADSRRKKVFETVEVIIGEEIERGAMKDSPVEV